MKHIIYDQFYTGHFGFFRQELQNLADYTKTAEDTNLGWEIKVEHFTIYFNEASEITQMVIDRQFIFIWTLCILCIDLICLLT